MTDLSSETQGEADMVKTWKEWRVNFPGKRLVWRVATGHVGLYEQGMKQAIIFSPTEAWRLFKKLSSDYRN